MPASSPSDPTPDGGAAPAAYRRGPGAGGPAGGGLDRAATIDVHAHVLFPALMGLAGEAGPEMGVADGIPFFRSGSYVLRGVRFLDSPFSDLTLRLATMDRLGIDHQVLSPNPLTYFHAAPVVDAVRFCSAQNDLTAAAVAAHPDRFSGFAQLPMQSPDEAVRELERAAGLGLVGSYIGTAFGDLTLDSPALEPVWAAHAALAMPVVVHPAPRDIDDADPGGGDGRRFDLDLVIGFAHDETAAVARLLFGGVLDRHPALRVHVPHGGGTAPYLKGRLQTALARRPWGKGLLGRPFDALWSQLSFDCLLGTDDALRFLIHGEGADRIMLGTNFAGWDQADDIVARVRATVQSPAARDLVLAGTAKRWFAGRAGS